MVAEIPTNNANSPFGLTESLTTNVLMLATNQAKLNHGVQLRWIVQAIMWVVRANGELVHHHVLQEKHVPKVAGKSYVHTFYYFRIKYFFFN